MKSWIVVASMGLLYGCFYPPTQLPPNSPAAHIALDLPYDLAWDTVQKVVARNDFHVINANPNAGVIEAQKVGGFTLDDADCGKLRGIAGKVKEEPDPDSSVVYDFHVEAKEARVSLVTVQGTFTTPRHVPLHPLTNVQCVSRGRQEAQLIREIKQAAASEHRDRTPVPGQDS
jgi:hypothetical protein